MILAKSRKATFGEQDELFEDFLERILVVRIMLAGEYPSISGDLSFILILHLILELKFLLYYILVLIGNN